MVYLGSPVTAVFIGAAADARLALFLPASAFQVILVLCLPIAALLVLRKKTLASEALPMEKTKRLIMLGFYAFVCGAYDGFYGPGAGTFMLLSSEMPPVK